MLYKGFHLVKVVIECAMMQQVGVLLIFEFDEVESGFVLQVVVDVHETLGGGQLVEWTLHHNY